MPRLDLVDPNLHPNTDHRIDGKVPDTIKIGEGAEQKYDGKGTATRVDLNIGVDQDGLPNWLLTLDRPKVAYTSGEVIETFDKATDKYRITAFMSVSNVCPPALPSPKDIRGLAEDDCACNCASVPEPDAILLSISGLAILIRWSHGGLASASKTRGSAKRLIS